MGLVLDRAGFAAGAVVALFCLAGWRIEAGSQVPGTDVTIVAAPSPGVTLSVTGPIAHSPSLPSARELTGDLTAFNGSAGAATARARVRGDVADLDDALGVVVSADGRRLLAGRLGDLRSWSRPFPLRPGGSRIVVRVRLPRRAENRFAAHAVRARLELRAGDGIA